jgi:hypothetical protein
MAAQTVFLNTGNMYVGDTLQVNGGLAVSGSGSIDMGAHSMLVLTGDLADSVSTGHVFSDQCAGNATVCFGDSVPQRVTIGTPATKAANYIKFPKLVVNKAVTDTATVTFDPGVAASTDSLLLLAGRLILDAKAAASPSKQTESAFLLVNSSFRKKSGDRYTGVQVNLDMGNNASEKAVSGFSSPFTQLYADYFLFNFLSAPSNAGLFGDSKKLIVDPYYCLEPGRGYLLGMGLYDDESLYTSMLDPSWLGKADPAARVKDKFRFSRATAPFSLFSTPNNLASGEQLNISDFSLTLKKGFNFLGNPYTAPLDLTYLTDGSQTGLETGFYVPTSGTGSYQNGKYVFNINYLKAQAVGGTTGAGVTGTLSTNLVAPMQMFIVAAKADNTNFIFHADKRSLAASGVVYTRAAASNEPVDELLFETTDEQTGGFDRASVVFRPDASLKATDGYDAVKLPNNSGGVNQLYTRSADGKNLTVSIVPDNTQRLTLYFVPASRPQAVRLRIYRQKSLHSIASAVLEDTRTGVKTDLFAKNEYDFTSAPGDKAERFVLHFLAASPTAAEETHSRASLQASTTTGGMMLSGLHPGTLLYIYDMNGRQVYAQRTDAETRLITSLPAGTYLVVNDGRSTKTVLI